MKYLPDFIICGIQKGGTTTLYHYLRSHPEIFMPSVKEVNFFTFNYHKGVEWYQHHFENCTHEKIKGEASPLYMWYEDVPKRMATVVPDVKLIFMLRDPIRRAYSNYWFNISRGTQDPKQSFGDAVRSEEGYWKYVTKGFYYLQIEKFLEFFPKENIFILISEEFFEKPLKCLKVCLEFLNVNTEYLSSSINLHSNVTLIPKNNFIKYTYNIYCKIKQNLKPFIPQRLRTITIKPRELIYKNVFTTKKKPPAIREQDIEYLKEIYRDHNAKLEEFIGRKLPW